MIKIFSFNVTFSIEQVNMKQKFQCILNYSLPVIYKLFWFKSLAFMEK